MRQGLVAWAGAQGGGLCGSARWRRCAQADTPLLGGRLAALLRHGVPRARQLAARPRRGPPAWHGGWRGARGRTCAAPRSAVLQLWLILQGADSAVAERAVFMQPSSAEGAVCGWAFSPSTLSAPASLCMSAATLHVILM